MAGPMTQAATRVVDAVNTRVARGYTNEMHAHTHLFPEVETGLEAGHIIEFGTEDFLEYQDGLKHAVGADRPEIEFGYQGKEYQLDERAVDGKLPEQRRREASRAHGLDMGMHTVRGVASVVSLQVEIAAAALATNAALYDSHNMNALSGGNLWSDPASDPAKDVAVARERIATNIGLYPNLFIAGPKVSEDLARHPDVLDQVKHTRGLDRGRGGMIIEDADLAQFFRVPRYITARARKGQPGAFTPVWGRHAVLAYSDASPLRSKGSPSYGYTYRLTGYPIVAPAWFRPKNDSWYYPYTTYSTPVVAGQIAAYLWPNAVIA